MRAELSVLPMPLEGCPEADSNELATLLEKCCFRDRMLQRSYARYFEKSDRAPLGLSWNGVITFVIDSKDHLIAFCKAILAAFAGKEVEVRVKFGDKEVVVRTRNADLSQVLALVQSLIGSLT